MFFVDILYFKIILSRYEQALLCIVLGIVHMDSLPRNYTSQESGKELIEGGELPCPVWGWRPEIHLTLSPSSSTSYIWMSFGCYFMETNLWQTHRKSTSAHITAYLIGMKKTLVFSTQYNITEQSLNTEILLESHLVVGVSYLRSFYNKKSAFPASSARLVCRNCLPMLH